MTREQVHEGNRIIEQLNRIDSVLEVREYELGVNDEGEVYSHKATEPVLQFSRTMQSNDLQILARNFSKEFLSMLYEKKLQLEEKLAKL